MRRSVSVVAAVVVFACWGEWLNWRWSRALVHDRHCGSVAVVVPGFRNPQLSVNAVNRWRTRIGLRSATMNGPAATLIFSGGAVAGRHAEAAMMAEYAAAELGYAGSPLIEDQSRTSWENVSNAIPLVEHADRIVFASQPAHALKLRAYVDRQRPDLTERLVRGGDYRFGEAVLLKPLMALYGLWTLRGISFGERHTGGRNNP